MLKAELERATRNFMNAARGEQRADDKANLSDEEFERAYTEQVELAKSKLHAIRTA